ncbi:type IV pilus biogenesis/stability protein PilW [Vibrio sp. SCSIO 43136]|uniref:type IV pilus biogenesis/stability protein PilW n=1 Tax=Vibrio sp. SCSIO 43136 TaxID=2819101 RepID=UPI0020761A27|nr:type IV pilus biogenesis/stability protein PilW [Vibrio sp. SCSIO 43136]USD65797.1 type IV pilus biogenesis/stability protein PilW [Vibrio sp. SCSIO 43136]
MFARFVYIILVSLISGCVTVTQDKLDASFDRQAAAEARVNLGLSYLESGDRVRAKENIQQALEYRPNYYRALIAQAHYYDQVGEPDNARQSFEQALRESPDNGDVLNNYGVFLCKLGEYETADAFFNRAIEVPYYYLISASYQNAAFCALKSGDKHQAQYYFRRALDHDPKRVSSILQLAQLEIELEQYREARVRLVKFHHQFGYRAASLGLLIELEEKNGNLAMAERYRQALAQKYPDSIQYQKYVRNKNGTIRN